MNNPKVSIIIPCFNRSFFLGDTLKSVSSQTFENWECIIVNDGSVDNTESISQEWCKKDSRFRYFFIRNSGVSMARNFGIKMAKGEYIAFCDDDDFWTEEKLEKQVKVLDDNYSFGVVTGNIAYVNENGIKTGKIKSHRGYNHGNIFKNLLLKNRTSTVTLLLRREIFEKVGFFNPDFNFAEDWELWRRISYYYKFYFIDEIFAFVRLHNGNVTTNTSKTVFERFLLYKKLTYSLLSWGENNFKIEEINIIKYFEWCLYRKLFSNNLLDSKSKMIFLKNIVSNDYKDFIRLLKLYFKYNKLIKTQK